MRPAGKKATSGHYRTRTHMPSVAAFSFVQHRAGFDNWHFCFCSLRALDKRIRIWVQSAAVSKKMGKHLLCHWLSSESWGWCGEGLAEMKKLSFRQLFYHFQHPVLLYIAKWTWCSFWALLPPSWCHPSIGKRKSGFAFFTAFSIIEGARRR